MLWYWLNYSWNNSLRAKLYLLLSLAAHFVNIFSPSFQHSAFFFSTFLLSLSASSPSLSVSVNDWKEKTDDPRIKTYWQLLSEHIYQTHIHRCMQEWAHACIYSYTHTHTQVRLTVNHLMVSLEISKFCLQPNQETHRYLMLFWCQMTFSRHVFKFLNRELLRHF